MSSFWIDTLGLSVHFSDMWTTVYSPQVSHRILSFKSHRTRCHLSLFPLPSALAVSSWESRLQPIWKAKYRELSDYSWKQNLSYTRYRRRRKSWDIIDWLFHSERLKTISCPAPGASNQTGWNGKWSTSIISLKIKLENMFNVRKQLPVQAIAVPNF